MRGQTHFSSFGCEDKLVCNLTFSLIIMRFLESMTDVYSFRREEIILFPYVLDLKKKNGLVHRVRTALGGVRIKNLIETKHNTAFSPTLLS